MTETLKFGMLLGTVALGVSLALGGCADLGTEKLADCVEVYSGTGATRLSGYTRTACEDHCRTVQGAVDCYWDGRVAAVAEPVTVALRDS